MRIVGKTLLRIAAAAAVLAGSAAAQLPMPSFSLQNDKQKTPQQVEHDQAIDRAYRSATKKIPDKNIANDPWADVRSAPTPPPPKKKLQTSPSKKQQLSQGNK
jgi:hypothetical protein